MIWEKLVTGQAVGGADGVVVGQAVVAAALDVERRQVEAAGAGGPKRKLLRILRTILLSISWALSVARYLRIGSARSAGPGAG